MMGLALQGLALVTLGEVAEGMRRLDEVNAAIVAGELHDVVAIGLASCHMIAACDRVRDYDRAIQWCNRLKDFSARSGYRALFAVCRTQYASICMWRGMWNEAEEELSAADRELTETRPGLLAEAVVRLADCAAGRDAFLRRNGCSTGWRRAGSRPWDWPRWRSIAAITAGRRSRRPDTFAASPPATAATARRRSTCSCARARPWAS